MKIFDDWLETRKALIAMDKTATDDWVYRPEHLVMRIKHLLFWRMK